MTNRRKIKEGEEFVFCNGKIAQNVAQCKKEIQNLSQDEFSFHVNDEKNDFYNWIKDCIDPKLAEDIKDIKDQTELVKLLK